MIYDYIVIGGGIVGMSTAWQLQQRCPGKKVLLLEKEAIFAKHQTGHNSGVIHAGVYYQPDSLKAKFCREGATALMDFCRQNGIEFQQCGKLLVATSQAQLKPMRDLFARCHQNGIEVELLNQQQLKIKEPNVTGLGAIWVSQTAIVDYQQVTNTMAQKFVEAGGEFRLNAAVVGIQQKHDRVELNICHDNKAVKIEGRFLISCAGLMADRIAALMGIKSDFQIVPFRGEYYQLSNNHNKVVNHLIYPIPDPQLPFLGIHLTKMIDGSITVGPNAVQGWKREGYGQFNFSLRDTLQLLSFSGFWLVSFNHFASGLKELKNSWFKRSYLKQVKKYCPQIEVSDLLPYPTGIRAQAVLKDGTLVDDFLFSQTSRSLHVCNAPSPAATAAIPIGEYICDKVLALMDEVVD
jgi:L-2-hydroxyglutarate oxidase